MWHPYLTGGHWWISPGVTAWHGYLIVKGAGILAALALGARKLPRSARRLTRR